MDDEVVTVIKACQPYASHDTPREGHGLATLSRLENLDKHRDLIPFAWGLVDCRLYAIAPSWTGEFGYSSAPFVEEGTRIIPPPVPPTHRDPEMKVWVEGIPVITVNAGLPRRFTNKILGSIRTILDETRLRIWPRLEPHVTL